MCNILRSVLLMNFAVKHDNQLKALDTADPCMICQIWPEQVIAGSFNKTIKTFSPQRSLLLLRPLKWAIVLNCESIFWKSHQLFTATLTPSNVKVIHNFFVLLKVSKGVLCRKMFWLFNCFDFSSPQCNWCDNLLWSKERKLHKLTSFI